MDEIITQLQQSIVDEVFSRTEKRSLKALLAAQLLDENQINFLRSKIYEMALESATPENYPFIIEWLKQATNALRFIPSGLSEKSDAYFSPGDACRNAIIRQINHCTSKVKICVFTISDDRIASAILTAHQRGIAIQVITDNDKSLDLGSDIERLAKEGIVIKMDNTPNHMHHKFMITDDHALITGSYNWTLSAAKYNQENILLTQEVGAVKAYLNEFDQLWERMVPYDA